MLIKKGIDDPMYQPAHSPCKDCSEVRDDPLRRVAAEDGDGVVSVEAEVDEGPGGDLNVRQVLLVRPLLPLPVALHAQRSGLQMQSCLTPKGKRL